MAHSTIQDLHCHIIVTIVSAKSASNSIINIPSVNETKKKNYVTVKQETDYENLLEKWKGVSTPDLSLAAQPKALFGCSVSGDFAICLSE